jgi:hypothetical protein
MWPAQIARDFEATDPPPELIRRWRGLVGTSSDGRLFAGQVSDSGYDLVLYQRHGFPIVCRGRFEPAPAGTRVRAEFASGVSFLWVVVAAMVCASAAFVGLLIWDASLAGPWAIICGSGAVVAVAFVVCYYWFSLMAAGVCFDRRLIRAGTSE